jgi:hypothetical protein
VALTKAKREERRLTAIARLREAWHHYRSPLVTVTIQRGRQRPRFTGRVVFVATSGAFCLLDDGGEDRLHVPLDDVVSVSPCG